MAKSKSVLLGFSGGIDSTAAAAILREEGYDVHLDTLDTTGDPELLQRARETAPETGTPMALLGRTRAFPERNHRLFYRRLPPGRNPGPLHSLQSADQMGVPVQDGNSLRI